MTQKSKTNQQKYFVCDSVINKFSGIFSANYCWPEECEQELRPKSWSRAMTQYKDRFESNMWSQVIRKVPLISDQNVDKESIVLKINKCLFGLILKELGLLTSNEKLYYESILDLFNDQISFGLIFYLKLCSQFNWRLVYCQLIGEHKHSKTFTELLFKEIESSVNENLFTIEEISYFYSLVECLALKLMANNIIDGQVNDQRLVDIYSNCRQKLSQLRCDRFVSCLAVYNILTQELIAMTFKLLSNDCICDEQIKKQLSSIEELISETFSSIETDCQIDFDNKRVCEDIATARDINESLELMNKKYYKTTSTRIELPSLQHFYNFLNSKCDRNLQKSRFDCLARVLTHKQNPDYQHLIEILLSLGDFNKHKSLFILLKPIDIISYDLIPKLAEKAMKTRDEKSKKFFTSLLYESLKIAPTIDLKSRLRQFKINKINEANCDIIKTLFNQITKNDKSEQINDLNRELLIGVYFDPFAVYDLILDLALHHNRAQIGLVSQIITGKLYYVSKFTSNQESETFLMKFIIHKLVEKPSLQLVDDIVKLIVEINSCKLEDGFDCVLPLDQLFYFIIGDECLAREDVVWLKILLMKHLVQLSGDQYWDRLQTNPVPTIAYIIQFLDYFWRNSSRKQLVVDILNLILKQKMTRNLTEEELTYIDNLLSKRRPTTASTHKIYLAYIEERFPKPIREVIDITRNIYHDQILHYASITKDFMWICDIYTNYEVFTDQTKRALEHILPSLITQEWIQLFKFLRMYYYDNVVINFFRGAILRNSDFDQNFMIQTLVNIVLNYLLIPTRNESIERLLTEEDTKYRRFDLGVLFRSMASLDFLLPTTEVRVSLREILVELATRMKNESIDGYSYYENEEQLSPLAKEVLRSIYGFSYPVDVSFSDKPFVGYPVGMSNPSHTKNTAHLK